MTNRYRAATRMDDDGIFTIKLKGGMSFDFRPVTIAIDDDHHLQGTDYLDNEGPTIQGYDVSGNWLRIPFCWLTATDTWALLNGIRSKSRSIRCANATKHPRDPLAVLRPPAETVA